MSSAETYMCAAELHHLAERCLREAGIAVTFYDQRLADLWIQEVGLLQRKFFFKLGLDPFLEYRPQPLTNYFLLQGGEFQRFGNH